MVKTRTMRRSDMRMRQCNARHRAPPLDAAPHTTGLHTLLRKKHRHRPFSARIAGILSAMHIWVDADACPGVIKDILYRAAERLQIQMTLVANKLLRTPPSQFIRALQVPHGFDVADNEIVGRIEAGDLVITADIPLAAEVIERGGHALNPRGEFYTPDNIRERLELRNFLDGLRGQGVQTSGPAPLDQTDRKRFADQLDRFLARQARAGSSRPAAPVGAPGDAD
jgi:uncharacterized protein YaiI (UPF0178 family)